MPEARAAARSDLSGASEATRHGTRGVGRDRRDSSGPDWRRSWIPDALVAATLTAVAFIARRGGLPTDGLWHDDAWVVFGATKGSLSQLFTVGADHPGFTLLLMAWTRLGGSVESMAYPALIAGTLGPPSLYLVLRRLGFERSISALLGATLAAAEIHIMYSGRVKTYALDVLIVLGLVAVVAGLTNTRWRWHTAVAWVTAAIVVGSVSGFALVATAAAGIVFILHPGSDRRVRFVAVGAQATLQLILFEATQRTYNTHELEVFWARHHDAYLDFDINPIRFGAELVEHLSRIAHVFPGGNGWWSTLCVIIALLGLLGTALTERSSPNAIRARYLLIIFLIAIAGGVLDKVPFGPARGGSFSRFAFSRGERASLWLIPLLAVGLAITLQAVRRLSAHRPWRPAGFDAVLYFVAAIVLIMAVSHDAPPYAFRRSESAVKFVQSELGKHDGLLVIQGRHYQLALDSDFDASIWARPHESIGFVPEFADPRVHVVESAFDRPDSPRVSRRTREAIRGVDRVIIYGCSNIFICPFLSSHGDVLRGEGFQESEIFDFGTEIVLIWQRSP